MIEFDLEECRTNMPRDISACGGGRISRASFALTSSNDSHHTKKQSYLSRLKIVIIRHAYVQ